MGFPLSRRPGRVYLWNRPKEEAAAPAERIVAPRGGPVAAGRPPPPAGRVYLAPLARPPVTERPWPLRQAGVTVPAPAVRRAHVHGSGWLARPPVTERPQPLASPVGVAVPAPYVRRARVSGMGWLGRTPVAERTLCVRPVVGQHPVPAPGRIHGLLWDIKTPVVERPQPLRTPVAAPIPLQAVAFAQVYGTGWLARTPVGERPRPRAGPIYGGTTHRLTRADVLGRWSPKEEPVAADERVRPLVILNGGTPRGMLVRARVYGLFWKLREPVDSRTWPVRPVRVAGWPPPLLGRASALGLPWRHEEAPVVEPPSPTKGRRPRRIAISRPIELLLEDVLLVPAVADRWREGIVPMAEPGVLGLSLSMASRMRSPVTAWAAELGSLSVTLAGGRRTRAGHAPRASRIWEEEDALLLGVEPVLE